MRTILALFRNHTRSVNNLITFCAMLILSGCTGDRCIDADDFGFPKITISSRYKKEDLTEQQQGNQVAPWIDSKFNVNGRPLALMVKTWRYGVDRNKGTELSAWCPWYGQEGDDHTLSKFCERLIPCTFVDNRMCTATKDARIANAPCLMKNGVGLYALIADRGTDPNSSFISERSPSGITFHVGEPHSDYSFFDFSKTGEVRPAGGLVYKYDNVAGVSTANARQQYADSRLYFKILDKFYNDNNGQYRVVIKSGVTDTRPDPIEFLTKLVKDNLFGTGNDYGLIRNIYMNIISNPSYQLAVKGMLSLYVIFSVFSYLIGNINVTHTELIVRVFKIAVVSALLSSQYAWSFFNNYLFVYFVGGVEQIVRIIKDAAESGPGSSSILGLMIAPQTMAKLWSLLFSDWLGFIYIILFLIALYFILMLMFEAAVIYMTALIAIGMIIVMGPIFICFLLFDITKSLFENWLKQLISYAIQPLILFTGIAFISIIIRTEIYSALGFRVCKFDFPNLGPIGKIFGDLVSELDLDFDFGVSGGSIFYWWFPNPMRGEKFTRVQQVIPVPVDLLNDDGTLRCEAFGCNELRYLELPFLDPVKDTRRINNFFQGNFVQLDGLLLIFVSLYLLSKFNSFAVSTAKFITGTSGNLTSVETASSAAFNPIKQGIDSAIAKPFKMVDEKLGIRKGIEGIKEGISHKVAKAYEDRMLGSLEKDALDPKKANQAVLEEMKRNHGMDQKDLKEGAIGNYNNALKAKLKELGVEDSKLDAKMKDLEGKNYKELRDELAAVKLGYGKKYKDLTATEKKEFDQVMKKGSGDETFRELFSNAKFSRDFQKAYVDAHQDMSKKGIGVLGKNISGFRKLKEIDNRVKGYRENKEATQRNRGERLYAGYEGIKRGMLSGMLDKDTLGKVEGNLTGAAWHDHDYRDPALRTHSEKLKEQQKELEYEKFRTQIERENAKAGQDVFKPEYKLELEKSGRKIDLEKYKELERRKLEHDIHDALRGGEDPAIMGEKFMREKATDQQLRDMIDNSYKVRHGMVENDRYLKREDHYEAMFEKSADHIEEKHKTLKEHFGEEIKPEEMTKKLEEYYDAKRKESPDGKLVNEEEAKKDVKNLQKSLHDFEYSQKVLEKMDERRAEIANEVQKNVDEVNKIRKDSGMEEYKAKPEDIKIPEKRKLRTVEQHLRPSKSL